MKKAYKLLALTICFTFLFSMTVFANGSKDTVSVNDIIVTEMGEEIVIAVLEDGRFITAPLGTETYTACNHTDIVGTGQIYRQTSSYNKTDSKYCYKYRDYETAVCARCGKTGFKIWQTTKWINKEHTYKLFGITCTKCGYQK